jgi:hypothetical protein
VRVTKTTLSNLVEHKGVRPENQIPSRFGRVFALHSREWNEYNGFGEDRMKTKKVLRMIVAAMLAPLIAAPMFAQAPSPQDQAPSTEQAPTPPLPEQVPPPEQAPPQAPPAPQAAPPAYTPVQLDQMVSPIALYPDPLLAQILAGATYPDQIPDAAQWADQHHYLTGQALADAIQSDQLTWDPSVQALLPFPSVLHMMASDMPWTSAVGNAFLAQQQDVMNAVQRERAKAMQYGYLRTNGQVVVAGGPYITVLPVNPAFVVVPYYNPAVVFFAPAPGFFVGGAIRFGFGVSLGLAFRPWGWGVVGINRFDWGAHRVFINEAPWGRTWANRAVYVHPYPAVRRFTAAQRAPDAHALHSQTERERQAARGERPSHEEHHDEHSH